MTVTLRIMIILKVFSDDDDCDDMDREEKVLTLIILIMKINDDRTDWLYGDLSDNNNCQSDEDKIHWPQK